MINKLLHALSNRDSFHEPVFRSDTGFSTKVVGEEERKLRALLLLDVTDTDYYLKVYLGLIHAYPDIEAHFDDKGRTYDVEDFGIQAVQIDGADFMSAVNAIGLFTDPVSEELPVNLRYRIRYDQPEYAELSVRESGLIRKSRYNLSADGKVIHIDWPDDFPFSGPLQLQEPWAMGSEINIAVEPRHFPYEVMVSRLSNNAYLIRQISEAGLVDEYVNTQDHQRKVAIALAILAANNTSVFP